MEYVSKSNCDLTQELALGDCMGHIDGNDNKTKKLLRDLNFGFYTNGRQVRRNKKTTRLVEEGESSMSNVF